jgi:phospholipid/cholesterol/gamma-HCH transport system substrate-binding protein
MAKVKPEKRLMRRSFGAGLIVLAVLAVIVALTFDAINGLPFRPTKIVRAEFGDIHSLAVNDDVRQNSKRIGRISELGIHGNNALVTMELDGDPEVYRNAHAAIWDVSALAAKFVELDPGTPDAGPLGDQVMPAKGNVDSSDIYQILDILDPQTRAATSTMLRQLGGGSAAHGGDLHDFLSTAPALLKNAGTVTEDMASPKFNLPHLIRSSDSLVGRFRGREQQISELVRQTDQTFQGFVVDGGAPLKTVLAKAPGTLRAVRPALDSLNGPLGVTRVAMTNLQSGAEGLGQATPDVRGFFREAVPVAHKVPGFSDDAKPAVSDLTDTVRDARPLAPRAAETFDYLQQPLHVLEPYAPELGQWFTRMHSFVSMGAENGKRYAHLAATYGAPTVTGGVLHSDAKRFIDPYPKPGQANGEHLGPGLPAGIGIGGSHR